MEERSRYGEEKQLIIYDCEIVKAIPPSESSKCLEGIEYCKGWRDFENMGISVICAYEYGSDRYRVFCKDNFNGFQELIDSSKLIVSFKRKYGMQRGLVLTMSTTRMQVSDSMTARKQISMERGKVDMVR